MTEQALQRAILQALASKGVWAQRLNSGSTMVGVGPSRRLIRGCEPGTPDILVLSPYGFLEVKTVKGKLQPSQIAWHARAAAAGVRVAVVRSIEDALEIVERWRSES